MDNIFHKWRRYLDRKGIDSIISEDEDLQSFHALTFLLTMEYKCVKKKYEEMKQSSNKRFTDSLTLLSNSECNNKESPDLFGNHNQSQKSKSETIIIEDTDVDSSPTIVKKSKKLRNLSKCKMELQFSPIEKIADNIPSKSVKPRVLKQIDDLNVTSIIPGTPSGNKVIITKSKPNKEKFIKKKKSPTLTQLFKNVDNVILKKGCIKKEPTFVANKSRAEEDCDETFFIPEKDLLAKSGTSFAKPSNTEPNILLPFKKQGRNETLISDNSLKNTINESTIFEDEMEIDQPHLDIKQNDNEFDSYNKIPEKRKSKSPDYVYKENAPRKKADKLKLKGWDCPDCEHFYANRPELSASQLQELKDKCSKHRSKFRPQANTPPGYWDPCFGSQFSENTMI